MQSLSLNSTNIEYVIKETIDTLTWGGVIVYPTDTLYGLGANALNPAAIDKVFAIKQRPRTKPMPIIVRNIQWAEALAYIYARERKILEMIWPGTITVILPKRKEVPDVVTAGKPNVALRVTSSPFVNKLLGKFGYPLTGTSANISGEEPTPKIENITMRFKKEIYRPDLLIDVGPLPLSDPSTILDLTGPKPKILRVGPTKPEILLKLLGV